MEIPSSLPAPRILILETDPGTRSTLRRYVIKAWRGASVQASSQTLEAVVDGEPDRLQHFDVLLVGCDFSADGTTRNATLRALRALSADPASPRVILLTERGSEYTAVQAIKAGAFDYIPKRLLGREQVVPSIEKAFHAARPTLPADPARDNAQPRLFGYDLRQCLATHETTSVHVAYSAEHAKEVVLKILRRGRGALAKDQGFERLIDEFKHLADIDDPAVAEIYDFRVTPQHCYIAMEYFPLGHLGLRLTQPLDPVAALAITEEIAHALAIVHTAGVVHLDLKPGNIMLRESGTVALIDFGISRLLDCSGAEAAPDIAGTPYYMSPEQVGGQPTDERADLYALGVILYQLLTGQKPYVGETAAAILRQHSEAPVPRLPEPLRTLQGLLDRLLAKQPEQRPASAREVGEALESARQAFAVKRYEMPTAPPEAVSLSA